jgi:hypothetical protein
MAVISAGAKRYNKNSATALDTICIMKGSDIYTGNLGLIPTKYRSIQVLFNTYNYNDGYLNIYLPKRSLSFPKRDKSVFLLNTDLFSDF